MRYLAILIPALTIRPDDSAIVGMITMFALFPIPMWVSSRFQGTQEHKMAAVRLFI
jgi:hypothetical protein